VQNLKMNTSTRISTQQRMYGILQDYTSSGQSKQEWCKINNLPLHKLHYWQRKFKNEQNTEAPGFMDLKVKPDHTCNLLTIIYPNGVQIKFESTISAHLLQNLIHMY